jgi:hypothetical protein
LVVSATYTRQVGIYESREAAQKAFGVLSIEEPNAFKESANEVDLEGIVSPFGNPFANRNTSAPTGEDEDEVSSVSSESDDESATKRVGVGGAAGSSKGRRR